MRPYRFSVLVNRAIQAHESGDLVEGALKREGPFFGAYSLVNIAIQMDRLNL